MMTDRRQGQRISCFISTGTSKGDAILEELSPTGARLSASFPALLGEMLLLNIPEQGGGVTTLRSVVRRLSPTPLGLRLGCQFVADLDIRRAAARLFERVSKPRRPVRVA